VNRYLLYCIFRSSPNQKPEDLLGVDHQPLLIISSNGLSAAVSEIVCRDFIPDLDRVLAYKKVVESFHRNQTVIPMRFGCLFEEKQQVIKLLEKRSEQYDAVLDKLEGCIEMGIRILISNAPICTAQPETRNEHITTPGKAYLEARKTCYAQEENLAKEIHSVCQQCCESLGHLFVECRMEQKRLSAPKYGFRVSLPSFNFLVPRENVDSFREIFRQMRRPESAKLFLNGPWPPYNFVLEQPL